MTSENRNPKEALHITCPGCGGDLRYSIKSGKMQCAHCSGEYDIQDIPDPSLDVQDGSMETFEYRCPQCGAAIHSTQTSTVNYCIYCGSEVVFMERLSRCRRPDGIVPFKVSREDCELIYRNRLKKAVLAPNKLRSQETYQHFQPVYIPFWKYKSKYSGKIEGQSVQVERSEKEYLETRYRHSLQANVWMTDVLYDASRAFDDDTAMKLGITTGRGKSGREAQQAFHPGYLCGFYAEAADTDESAYQSDVKALLCEQIARKLAGSDHNCVGAAATLLDPMETSAELVLLPVWLLASREGERVLYTAIDGTDGSIICDTTVSPARFAVLAGVFAALVYAALLFLDSVLIIRPNILLGLCGILASLIGWLVYPALKERLEQKLREKDPSLAKLVRQQKQSTGRESSHYQSNNGITYIPGINGLDYGLKRLLILLGCVSGYGLFCAIKTNAQFAFLHFILLVILIIYAARHWTETQMHKNTGMAYMCRVLYMYGLGIAIFFTCAAIIHNGNNMPYVNAFVSDTALFPALLLLMAFGSELYMVFVLLHGMKPPVLLYILAFVTGAAAVRLPFIRLTAEYYLISALLLLLLLMYIGGQYRYHNKYVTRPVPVLRKEASGK